MTVAMAAADTGVELHGIIVNVARDDDDAENDPGLFPNGVTFMSKVVVPAVPPC
jgi:hypothetical protein